MKSLVSVEQLLSLRNLGYSDSEIGQMVGLTRNGVWTKLSRAGYKRDRPLLKAEVVDSIKFTICSSTGYYRSTINVGEDRVNLHVYLYTKEHGLIPRGSEIHHIDLNKTNNALDNLVCLSRSEHRALHARRVRNSSGMFI